MQNITTDINQSHCNSQRLEKKPIKFAVKTVTQACYDLFQPIMWPSKTCSWINIRMIMLIKEQGYPT